MTKYFGTIPRGADHAQASAGDPAHIAAEKDVRLTDAVALPG